MRLSFLISFAFAGTIFAAPTVEAPAQEITDVKFILDGFSTIISNAAKLADKITSLKPGDDVIARLKEMSALSGSTIKTSEQMTKDINALKGKLSSEATVKVAEPAVKVATSTVTIINDLVAKKDLFVKAGVHKIVSDDLNHLYDVSIKFLDAAKAKVPDQYASIVSDAFKQILDALQKGIKNFASTS
jgi:Hydrophobic surface binding protein A